MFLLSNVSFVRLWINGYDWGLYWLMEDISQGKFLTSRFENATGNYYECGLDAFLEERKTPQDYQDATISMHGGTKNMYKQKQGTGDWSDFMKLIKVIHHTSISAFPNEIVKVRNLLT
jgi:hypothetical protein